jgi:hypothetical protein
MRMRNAGKAWQIVGPESEVAAATGAAEAVR